MRDNTVVLLRQPRTFSADIPQMNSETAIIPGVSEPHSTIWHGLVKADGRRRRGHARQPVFVHNLVRSTQFSAGSEISLSGLHFRENATIELGGSEVNEKREGGNHEFRHNQSPAAASVSCGATRGGVGHGPSNGHGGSNKDHHLQRKRFDSRRKGRGPSLRLGR